jgi:hypothetical protein
MQALTKGGNIVTIKNISKKKKNISKDCDTHNRIAAAI